MLDFHEMTQMSSALAPLFLYFALQSGLQCAARASQFLCWTQHGYQSTVGHSICLGGPYVPWVALPILTASSEGPPPEVSSSRVTNGECSHDEKGGWDKGDESRFVEENDEDDNEDGLDKDGNVMAEVGVEEDMEGRDSGPDDCIGDEKRDRDYEEDSLLHNGILISNFIS